MYNDVISLLKITREKQENGDITEVIVKRDVFAQVKSIGMREKYQAHAVGLKPELIFEIADYLDYEDEEFAEYEGTKYNIFRTYKKDSNALELTVMR